MPDVDLSTLAAPELRRLLDAARGRGQATLSYQILQEMEARRDRGARTRLPGRKRAGPRVIDLNLSDDPLDRWDEPADAADARALDAGRDTEPEPDPAASLYLDRAPPPPVAPPRRSRWIGLGLIVGVAVGVPLGLGMGRIIPEPVSPLMVPTESAVAVAAPVAPPPVAVPPAPPPPSAPIPADPPAAAEATPANALPPSPAPADIAAAASAPAAPIEEAKEDAPPPPPAAKPCAGAATPADRAICGDPNLQRLQRELRDAYAQALQAHEDRTLLRQRQLAWRAERDSVSDPDKLAQLYEQRIRKLNAATADAKHQR